MTNIDAAAADTIIAENATAEFDSERPHSRYFTAELQPELAWSTEQVPEQQPCEDGHPRSWLAAVAFALGITAVTAATVAGLATLYQNVADTWSAPVTVSAVPPGPEVIPVPQSMPLEDLFVDQGLAATQNSIARADNIYLNLLKEGGVSIYSTSAAIDYGHVICGARAHGISESRAIEIEATSHPEMGWQASPLQVKSAETAYCPQYLGAKS